MKTQMSDDDLRLAIVDVVNFLKGCSIANRKERLENHLDVLLACQHARAKLRIHGPHDPHFPFMPERPTGSGYVEVLEAIIKESTIEWVPDKYREFYEMVKRNA